MDLGLIDDLDVPNELFFVRSNGEIPTIDPAKWTLPVDGEVERRIELTLAELEAMPQVEQSSFLECTGNGRSRFHPKAKGTTWKNDAAGNAVWGGVRLRDVLEMAGVHETGIEVVSQGSDLETMQRGLPLSVAMQPTTLIALRMNGAPLPVAHGFPARLIVPGWAGIASTKWLSGLTVSDRPFVGPFQGDLYVVYDTDGTPIQPVREMPVKSIISHPSEGAKLPEGAVVTGFAWSGYGGIEKVETSLDHGESWHKAAIVAEAGPLAWVRWEQRLVLPPGSYEIVARATDRRGLTQPWTAFWNQKGYFMNEIQQVGFSVAPQGDSPNG
ncbi:MAG: sulfite oxidase [Thermomicrobiales bacterium]|nr:sulfite oxidase [Thermomicrobiales bacterium]